MKNIQFHWVAAALVAGLFLAAAPLCAQDMPYQAAPVQQQQQPAPVYSQPQLDQMLAPIALYPDALVAQILMASTYPLEVVEAERWLQLPQNAALRGDQLAAVLEQQAWDPSVKSLVPFPQILQMMNQNLQWTEQLGDAFLANQPAVMNTVQQLRQQALAAGTLRSTPQQTVLTQDQDILIDPVNPNMVYVPYYNPNVVYGAWAYPDYPPVYFTPSPGYAYNNGAYFNFGVGVAILTPFWGWDHWDWRAHHIDIDDNRFRQINHGNPPPASGVWQHDPAHRGGVPYQSPAARAQFQHASDQDRRGYRGYNPAALPQPQIANHFTNAPAAMHSEAEHNNVNNVRPDVAMAPRAMASAPAIAHATAVTPPRAMPVVQHAAPIFESLPHGADAHAHAERGIQSRAVAAHPAPPARAAPAAHAGDNRDHGGR